MRHALERSALVLLIPLIFLSGCATVINPASGRKEYLMISTQQEISIGEQVSAEIEKSYRLSHDEGMIERANRIGLKIAKVSDRQDLAYHFKVLDNKDTNAVSTPGGYVYVYSGLMEKANDDELAAVIAHEVGHIAARHSVQAMQSNMATSLVAGLIFASMKTKNEIRQGTDAALNLIMLGYSRGDELEADNLGVRYAYYAGFDPDGSATFLEKLQKEQKENPMDKGLVYLRSHPLNSERIKKDTEYAAYLKRTDPARQHQNLPILRN